MNAEVLCLGLVSVAIFMLVMPLFKTSGGILLQMAPPNIPASALSKCWRQVITLLNVLIFLTLINCWKSFCGQIASREDVAEVFQARFWELVPGHVVGSLALQVCFLFDSWCVAIILAMCTFWNGLLVVWEEAAISWLLLAVCTCRWSREWMIDPFSNLCMECTMI